jgi:hypothetical protein
LIYQAIRAARAKAWQLQLTVPMGNAADNWEILLQLYELLDLYPLLAKIAITAKWDGMAIAAGNNSSLQLRVFAPHLLVNRFEPLNHLLAHGGIKECYSVP